MSVTKGSLAIALREGWLTLLRSEEASLPLDETGYLAFLNGQIAFFKGHADRAHVAHVGLRSAVVVLGAVLPAITAHPTSVAVIAVIVAICGAIDSLFKYGQIWRHNRQNQLELEALIRKYRRSKAIHSVVGTSVSYSLDDLFRDSERTISQEFRGFWGIRNVMDQTSDTRAKASD